MYGELLAVAMAGEDADARSEEELVQELTNVRVRLLRSPEGTRLGVPAVDAVSGLADQIEYDRVLLWLCRRHGIASGPEGFGRPEQERRRLEQALGDAGVLGQWN